MYQNDILGARIQKGVIIQNTRRNGFIKFNKNKTFLSIVVNNVKSWHCSGIGFS